MSRISKWYYNSGCQFPSQSVCRVLLIAVVLATLAVGGFDLAEAGVKVLGDLPQGLPRFVLPWPARCRVACCMQAWCQSWSGAFGRLG